MIDLSMTSCSPNIAGGVGRHQSAINRRTTSALPTTAKYLAMGTTDDSRELSNRTQLMVALLDRSHVALQIYLAGSLPLNFLDSQVCRRCFVSVLRPRPVVSERGHHQGTDDADHNLHPNSARNLNQHEMCSKG